MGSPPHMQSQLTSNPILQGDPSCILDLAPPKTIMIGLKKYKQARMFFLLHQNENWHSQHATALKR